MPTPPDLLTWLFENNFLDSSGNGYTAVEVGSVPFVSSPSLGQGTYAIGPFSAADYIKSPVSFQAAISGLSVWTQSARFLFNTMNDTQNVIVFYNGSDFIGLQILGDGTVRIFSSVGGLLIADSIPTLVGTGQAYIAGLSYDGTTLRGYLTALPGSTSTPVVTLTTSATIPAGSDFYLSRLIPGVEFPVDGFIDDARVTDVERITFPVVDPAPAAGESRLFLSPSIKL